MTVGLVKKSLFLACFFGETLENHPFALLVDNLNIFVVDYIFSGLVDDLHFLFNLSVESSHML